MLVTSECHLLRLLTSFLDSFLFWSPVGKILYSRHFFLLPRLITLQPIFKLSFLEDPLRILDQQDPLQGRNEHLHLPLLLGRDPGTERALIRKGEAKATGSLTY